MERGRVPFARVGADTNRAALECGALTLKSAVLVAMLERMRRDESGDVLVSRPRAEVAEELGVAERAVSEAVRGLVRDGALEVARRGHNGRSTVYRVLLPCGCVGT
jgi:DNA-binding MarR family transcriptional regulator